MDPERRNVGEAKPEKREILAVLRTVNANQLAHPEVDASAEAEPLRHIWMRVTWYTGVVAAWKAMGEAVGRSGAEERRPRMDYYDAPRGAGPAPGSARGIEAGPDYVIPALAILPRDPKNPFPMRPILPRLPASADR